MKLKTEVFEVEFADVSVTEWERIQRPFGLTIGIDLTEIGHVRKKVLTDKTMAYRLVYEQIKNDYGKTNILPL
ncbi:hypothetical protein KKI24_23285 [bacterium]|nr:hypothetical protein [bacterium]